MNKIELRIVMLSFVILAMQLLALSWWEGPELPPAHLQTTLYLLVIILLSLVLFMGVKNRKALRWPIWIGMIVVSAIFSKLAWTIYAGIALGHM